MYAVKEESLPWNFTSKLLESLALSLGNEQRSEDTAEHEERKDLHDVVDPGVGVCLGSASCTEGAEHDLSDNSTDLS